MDDRFDGFSVRVFMEESGMWLAHFSELPEVSAFADSPENALAELYVAWCGVKETYTDKNLEIPVSPA